MINNLVMEKNILFSVVIPSYKATFFKDCLKSILCQSYTNFEIVIVDDCSPENLKDIVCTFDDNRIRYYRNEINCGALNVVDNWNICLEYAKGDYLICMGDDDMLAPDCLSEYRKLIGQNPKVNVFHARVKQIDEEGNYIGITDPRPEKESVLSMIYYRMLYRAQYIGDFLFRTSALKKRGGFYKLPYAWASDDITAFIAAKDYGIVNTNKLLFYYRINRKTISSTGNTEIKLSALIRAQSWYTTFIEQYEPKGEIDECLKQMLKIRLKIQLQKQEEVLLSKDLSHNFSLLFKWLKLKHRYSISLKIILMGFIDMLKNKYKNSL